MNQQLGKTKSNAILSSAWVRRLWLKILSSPDRMMAMKVVLAIVIESIPFILVWKPFYIVTLSLGTVAGNIAETDDHPKGRVKAVLLTIISFLAITSMVTLLRDYSIIFGIAFVISTVILIIIGGIGERYRGISYAAILIGIYAMLGHQYSPSWYEQSIMLTLGATFYSVISLALAFAYPWRPLEEQLSRGFMALSEYLKIKAKLFNAKHDPESEIARELAVVNIKVVNALEKCKEVLNSYGEEVEDREKLMPYLKRFMLLQSLHERAASSLETSESESASNEENKDILRGLGELFSQLSNALVLLSEHLLTGKPYQHPVSLEWIITSLQAKIESRPLEEQQQLILLLHNLKRSHLALKNLYNPKESTYIPKLGQDQRTIKERIKEQLTWKHPRMRHAIRISISFAIGLFLVDYFQMEKGEWILLTSLLVTQTTYRDTRVRFFERIMGTITGVILGIFVLMIIPTTTGQLLLMYVSVAAFVSLKKTNYSVAVIFITLYVLCTNNIIRQHGLESMFPRVWDTVIGAGLAFFVVRFLWPSWQKNRLPQLLANALKENANYFTTIVEAYQHPLNKDEDDYNYRLARRLAHKADNQLTLAWQSMRLEPKKQQLLMENALTLTYLNHALLSYISAFGSRRDIDKIFFEEFNALSKAIHLALNEAGNQLTGNIDQKIHSNMKPVLISLRERINNCEDMDERQQLRILYNIAGVSKQLLRQSEALRKASLENH